MKTAANMQQKCKMKSPNGDPQREEEKGCAALINTKSKIAPQVNSKKKDSDRNEYGNKY